MTELPQLRAAADAAQKLQKKLRQLVNRGDAHAADLADAEAAVASLRAIYDRHGLPAYDRDSRAEKQHRRDSY
jgi:hypothetical protein